MTLGYAYFLLLAAFLPLASCISVPSSAYGGSLHRRDDVSSIYDRAVSADTTTSSFSLSSLTAASIRNYVSGFNGDILFPTSPGFANATDAWALNYKLNAKVALVPTSANDVSIAIKWLTKYGIDFAIRSGGVAQSQSNQVVINMSKFNKVDYDASKGTVSLGPGNHWNDVYASMSSNSVTVLGGRVPYVGVGGYSIGGGISYLVNKYGLMADSIIDAQVVLADGSIKWASTDANLMYAVKGAGFTIGAVTELVVKAYPKPQNIYSGFLLFTMDQFQAIKTGVANTTATNKDPNVALLLGVVRSNGTQLALVFPIVFGTEAYAKSALSWIWQLSGALQDTTGPVTYEQLQSLQLAFVSHPAATSNYQQHSVVIKSLTPAIIQAAVDWQTALLQDPRWYGLQLLFEPFLPGAFSSHATPGAWPHSSPTLNVVQLFIEQTNAQPGDAAVNAAKLREGGTILEQLAGAASVLQRYPNYVLQGTPAIQFYGPNLPKLQSIKRQFDPSNHFNKDIAIAS